ncbi:uncharacterized protein FOMMEDRAFT_168000 [Fomitiporia mediterranea MF3/22]|uniref:uncharacterized protein n=1 Tax=Fomitiporia mediterranea (strain MF3/22) TaxID=694068 RepID=UPI0004408CB5|nr:uncharacterized protein FOMMEDRAFT_168000 [Fomitiporia mediterranea MF3/22]EJD02874.1 hypothetical protein FOMMEDRAFT_168000 [Fomitiporia mediterranea MF3/22]
MRRTTIVYWRAQAKASYGPNSIPRISLPPVKKPMVFENIAALSRLRIRYVNMALRERTGDCGKFNGTGGVLNLVWLWTNSECTMVFTRGNGVRHFERYEHVGQLPALIGGAFCFPRLTKATRWTYASATGMRHDPNHASADTPTCARFAPTRI